MAHKFPNVEVPSDLKYLDLACLNCGQVIRKYPSGSYSYDIDGVFIGISTPCVPGNFLKSKKNFIVEFSKRIIASKTRALMEVSMEVDKDITFQGFLPKSELNEMFLEKHSEYKNLSEELEITKLELKELKESNKNKRESVEARMMSRYTEKQGYSDSNEDQFIKRFLNLAKDSVVELEAGRTIGKAFTEFKAMVKTFDFEKLNQKYNKL